MSLPGWLRLWWCYGCWALGTARVVRTVLVLDTVRVFGMVVVLSLVDTAREVETVVV